MKEILINVTGKLTGLENDRFIIPFQMILISTCVNNSINMQKIDSVRSIVQQKSVKQKVFESFESFKISETEIKISKLIIRSLLFRCMYYYIDINFSSYS